MPMTEIANQVVQLQDVWRSDGTLLRERLLDAHTPASKFRIFEEMLLNHLRPNFDPAIQCAIDGALEIGERRLDMDYADDEDQRYGARRFDSDS